MGWSVLSKSLNFWEPRPSISKMRKTWHSGNIWAANRSLRETWGGVLRLSKGTSTGGEQCRTAETHPVWPEWRHEGGGSHPSWWMPSSPSGEGPLEPREEAPNPPFLPHDPTSWTEEIKCQKAERENEERAQSSRDNSWRKRSTDVQVPGSMPFTVWLPSCLCFHETPYSLQEFSLLKLTLAGCCVCRMLVDLGGLPSMVWGNPPIKSLGGKQTSWKCQSLALPVSLAARMVQHMPQVQPIRCCNEMGP